jgi:hypothetical protein
MVPTEGVDEEADARPMPKSAMPVWAETGAKIIGQAVRYCRALRCLAGNGQDRSTAISGYGPGRGVDVTEAGKSAGRGSEKRVLIRGASRNLLVDETPARFGKPNG